MFTLSSKRALTREIEELKAQIAVLTKQGQSTQRQGWGLGLEHGKEQLDIDRLRLERERLAAENARFEAQSAGSYARQVVQALLLLNGAAALAMLTFMGALPKEAMFKGGLSSLSDPLSFFSYGAAFAVLTGIFAWLSQATGSDGSRLWVETLRLFAVVLALGSLLLFSGGISHAEAAFHALNSWAAAFAAR